MRWFRELLPRMQFSILGLQERKISVENDSCRSFEPRPTSVKIFYGSWCGRAGGDRGTRRCDSTALSATSKLRGAGDVR